MRANYDYIIVGSGFGGSVAALRLAEKGYKVLVLEAGRRFRDTDFARTNWDLKRFLYLPALGLRGIMRLDVFKNLMVLSGAGVGGGSLVYANTLIEPTSAAFAAAGWPTNVGVASWEAELREHYVTAKRMLGGVAAPTHFPAEVQLRKAADALGVGDSFRAVDVGVYFGAPGVTVPDPYFHGDGPARSGCVHCGGCMVGCRHNAKNSLTKNYLYLAEKRGVEVRANAEVTALRPTSGGYEVIVREPGWNLTRPVRLQAPKVVLAAGVLGTLKLLLKCRDELQTLPQLSPQLGTGVRTNSECLLGVRTPANFGDVSQGVAIAAGVNANDHTKIEAVHYPAGSDAMGLVALPLIEGNTLAVRLWRLALSIGRRPVQFLRFLWPVGFARQTIILLAMQTIESKLSMRWARPWMLPFKKRLRASIPKGKRPPAMIPEAATFARKLAEVTGGEAGGSISDVLGMSFTAHILGGCPMGDLASEGVIDSDHQVNGYPGLYVVGGAAVPANLGVNPSLTITAMAERAMARVARKEVMAPDSIQESAA